MTTKKRWVSTYVEWEAKNFMENLPFPLSDPYRELLEFYLKDRLNDFEDSIHDQYREW